MSPLWPLFPVTLLTLLALLATSLTEPKGVPGGTRSCGRDQPRPKIAATAAGWRRSTIFSILTSLYGEDITIFCSSNDATNLTMRDVVHQLQAERLNSTTIQMTLIKPNVGLSAYIMCTDINTACTTTLRVEVACGHLRPTMAATTFGVRSERNKYSTERLYASYGDDITIFCSSNDASNLTIQDDVHQLQAERLNSTTIQVTLIKPDVGVYRYYCTGSITACTDTLRVKVACGHLSSTIAATTAAERSEIDGMDYDNQKLYSSYAEDITIFCSSNEASNLTIRDGDHQLQAERLNSTTIQVTLIKPDIGEYTYHCTDSITCTLTLRVVVFPGMLVTAPGIRQTQYYGISRYFVTRGESYKVYCTAQQTSNLTVSYNSHDIETKSVNITTLMATVSDHTEGERKYICTSSSSQLVKGVRIIVDYNPEARDFFCVLYIFRKLECWWKSTTSQNIFNLLLIYDQRSTLVCRDRSHALTAGCASVVDDNWGSYITDGSISVQLESCNKIFCRNQTFHIDLLSIAKPDPVDDLKVINTSSQGATVVWRQDRSVKYFTHKVEYRLLGRDWRVVTAPTEHCEYSDTCELQLALPCPDAHYELRVYIRYKEATHDMHWSEPATLFFFTAPSTGGELHPACRADFREPELTHSARIVALHDVRVLIGDERKDEPALKKYISGLKKKLAQVKTLIDAQK